MTAGLTFLGQCVWRQIFLHKQTLHISPETQAFVFIDS